MNALQSKSICRQWLKSEVVGGRESRLEDEPLPRRWLRRVRASPPPPRGGFDIILVDCIHPVSATDAMPMIGALRLPLAVLRGAGQRFIAQCARRETCAVIYVCL